VVRATAHLILEGCIVLMTSEFGLAAVSTCMATAAMCPTINGGVALAVAASVLSSASSASAMITATALITSTLVTRTRALIALILITRILTLITRVNVALLVGDLGLEEAH